MAEHQASRRRVLITFFSILGFITITGTAFAINQGVTNTRQAGSGTAPISSCDNEYKVNLGNPVYSTAVSDYVINNAWTDQLSEACIGESITMTVLDSEGDVVSDGSGNISGSRIGAVSFATPIPVSQSYTVKTVIYGRANS